MLKTVELMRINDETGNTLAGVDGLAASVFTRACQRRRSFVQSDALCKCICAQTGQDQLHAGVDAERLIERHNEKDEIGRVKEGDLPIIEQRNTAQNCRIPQGPRTLANDVVCQQTPGIDLAYRVSRNMVNRDTLTGTRSYE